MTFDLGPFPEASGYEKATALDDSDPLASYRAEFTLPDPDLIYLDGNSLGRLPLEAAGQLEDITNRQWGDRLIRSWNDGWWDMQIRLGDLIAPIVGAGPGEVIVSDSTSVNLYKLAWAALETHPERTRIVTDDLNFPTDVYILQGLAEQRGLELVIVESDGINGPVEAIADAVDSRTALLSLSHTVFKSGYTYDMGSITALGHSAGAMLLWDLSHSVGSVPIELADSAADLAVGCTYKYLNGGPGAPAFLYVRSDLQDTLTSPITAWWGHEDPFAFDLEFRAARGIRRFHTGTMPILSLAAIEPGLDIITRAGIGAIRAKSILLGEFLVDQWEHHLLPLGFGLASPRDPVSRGSHVSLSHPNGWPITRALIDVGKVVPDFRAPDNLRFGLSPLYTRFVDVHTALQRCRRIVETGEHERFVDVVALVT